MNRVVSRATARSQPQSVVARAFLARWCAVAALSLVPTACGSAPPPASPPKALAPPTAAEGPGHVHDASHAHEPVAAPSATAPAPGTAVAAIDPEHAAHERARPILEKHCAKCHTKAGEASSTKILGHFSMDTYPFGGHHANEMTATMRKVLGATGSKATMPRDRPGALQGDELAALLAWADAFDAAHPAPEKKHAPHAH